MLPAMSLTEHAGIITSYQLFGFLVLVVLMFIVLPVIDMMIGVTFPVVRFLVYILDQLTLGLMFSLNLIAMVPVFEKPV